jgi:hypothetical protein
MMFDDFNCNVNRVLEQNPVRHKFMERRQQRARAVIWLVSTVIVTTLLLAIIFGQR